MPNTNSPISFIFLHFTLFEICLFFRHLFPAPLINHQKLLNIVKLFHLVEIVYIAYILCN